uniref:Uncharacterized protein n=1 Tax=Picea glauca TaxID=3330 RepID=A0A117NJB1_PICGL|nr:hypothetical protein ABT39_MTgene1139 [Picea glauca]
MLRAIKKSPSSICLLFVGESLVITPAFLPRSNERPALLLKLGFKKRIYQSSHKG